MSTVRSGRIAGAVPFAASKVPVITGYFWAVKLLTTAMGEATSDYLVHRFNPYAAVLAGGVAFTAALAAQLRARRYVAWVYWLAVSMVSVFGTMAADVTHIVLGVPYVVSTGAYAVALAVIFALWYATEGTLSIHSIRTRRRELFYWATVLATFALGTAAGDMSARSLDLGFFASGVVFTVVIVVPAVAHWQLGMNPVLAFWFAYVLTRPIGASFADWGGIAHAYGGLGMGYGPVGLSLTILIVVLVGYLAVTGKDIEEGGAGPKPAVGGRHRAGPVPGRLR